jgi:hypothetical protein
MFHFIICRWSPGGRFRPETRARFAVGQKTTGANQHLAIYYYSSYAFWWEFSLARHDRWFPSFPFLIALRKWASFFIRFVDYSCSFFFLKKKFLMTLRL